MDARITKTDLTSWFDAWDTLLALLLLFNGCVRVLKLKYNKLFVAGTLRLAVVRGMYLSSSPCIHILGWQAFLGAERLPDQTVFMFCSTICFGWMHMDVVLTVIQSCIASVASAVRTLEYCRLWRVLCLAL